MNSRRERALFFLGSSLLLLWPAFINGYPYIFTDTVGYLDAGNGLALALLGKGWGSLGERSEVFSFSIYLPNRLAGSRHQAKSKLIAFGYLHEKRRL